VTLRVFQILLGRGDGETGPPLKAAIHIEGKRIVWASRFMKWSVGKSSDQARRWLRDKGAVVIPADLVEPSPYSNMRSAIGPVSWYRADPMGLVFGFQRDIVTRCNDQALIGESRAALRAFCREHGQSVSRIGTGLREYVWQDSEGIHFSINPPPSTKYATIQ